MAEVQITLKLTASEFQALRTELRDHAEKLRAERYDEKGKRIAGPLYHELTERESRTRSLVEKLG